MGTFVQLENVSLRFSTPLQRHTTLKDTFIQWFGRRRPSSSVKETHALRNVNLSVSAGERVGIVGSNGAGKSTLLRVVSGIYRPSQGEVKRSGVLVPLLQAGASFTFELTGRENILQTAAMLGVAGSGIQDQIDSILQFAEVAEFADVPVKYYSLGMRSRLAFATVTAISPEILLLDEAFGAGDLAFQDKAQRRIDQLVQRSEIIMMSSHRLDLMERICTRAIWLDQGSVVLDDTAKEVRAAYQAHQAQRQAA